MATLYTYKGSFRGDKCLIAAKYSKSAVNVVDFKCGVTSNDEAFKKCFPLGKAPALKTADGNCLTESNAIAYYLSTDEMRGQSLIDQAKVQQWISFSENELLPNAMALVFNVLKVHQAKNLDVEMGALKKALGVMNDHLRDHTYLATERITLADVVSVCNLRLLFEHALGKECRAGIGNVERWFNTMINQPNVKDIFGAVKLCDVAPAMHGPKAGGDGAGQKKQKKGGEAPKADKPNKKEEKVADEPEDAPKPKPKDPFINLPLANFDFDEWKRTISNNAYEPTAKSYLEEKFDAENMSVWSCHYKYPEELNMVFMTCNLIGGFYQRIEKMRKHSFGSMAVFGADKKNTIAGVWMWRGKDLAFLLDTDLQVDYESYEWKKLDWKDPAVKQQVHQYFKQDAELTFDGKKFNQGKIWK